MYLAFPIFMQGLAIYKSSAGSGKTFTLVKEYLKLVLKNPNQQPNILAITFTNKATGEMKHRIVHSLSQLAEGQNPVLLTLLEQELPGVNIKSSAKIVIEKILHNYSTFAVSTIDSFFHKIVKSFARELHLPLQFEIELDTGYVADQVIEKLLKELNERNELAGWLKSFLMEKLAEDKGWKIEREIAEISKELFRENGIDAQKLPARESIAAFRTKMLKHRSDYEDKIRNAALKGLQAISGSGLSMDDFAYKSKGPAAFFTKIYNDPGDCEMNSYVMKALDNAENWVSKKSPFYIQITDLAYNYLLSALKEIKNIIDTSYPHYCTATEALKYLYLIGILSDVNEQLKIYRDEKNIILISDLPKLLQAGITDNDTPFIYEKTGSVYKHYLIDEFQDTSDFQWNNIIPLIKNSLSNNFFTLVVGDVKQSVYRWRGGNMELLMKNIQHHLREFRGMTKELSLSVNYRSKKNIVEFNNSFFSNSTDILNNYIENDDVNLFDLAYKKDEIAQSFLEKNTTGGFVEIKLIDPEKEISSENLSAKSAEDWTWKDFALDRLLNTIRNSLKDGFHLKDIAILVRRNTEGNEIANFLFENGVEKVVSPDSLLINSSPRIRLLLSTLRYIANTRNNIARSHILHYISQNKYITNHLPVHDVFTYSDQSKIRANQFLMHLESLHALPIYEVAENIIRKYNFDKSPDAYLQRFLDLVLDYSIKYGSDINAFLMWFDENGQDEKVSLVIPENEDAINIMTIHKSKGLQFPVVIIPFADWELVPHRNTLLWIKDFDPLMPVLAVKASKKLLNSDFNNEYKKEYALSYLDNLNLLYVAFTRPEERLHIFTCYSEVNDSINKASQLIYSNIENKKEFNRQNLTFISGTKEKINKISLPDDITVSLNSFISNDWSNKLKIKTGKEVRKEKSQSLKKALFGTYVHEALASLATVSDLPEVITKLRDSGSCSLQEVSVLEETLRYLLTIENVSEWYDGTWNLLTEQELLLPGGEILRPDRVMIKNNSAVIVDYKTGSEDKKYHNQLNLYGKSLLNAGYSEVKKYILYIAQRKVVEVL